MEMHDVPFGSKEHGGWFVVRLRIRVTVEVFFTEALHGFSDKFDR